MNTMKQATRAALNIFTLLALLAVTLGMPSSARAAQPSNDVISNAVPFTSAPLTYNMSDTDFNDANDGANDPNVCGYGNPGVHTVWYSFTPTAYGKATLTTFGSGFDTILAVWTYSLGQFTPLACNDDDITPPNTGLHSTIENLQLKAGTKYYIEVVQYTSGAAPSKDPTGAVVEAASSTYLTLSLTYTEDVNIAAPGTKYDDKSPIFAYTGTWTSANSAKAYAGSFKLSKVVGNTASLTFDGNQFKIYYTTYYNYGKMDLFLDGSATPLGTIDQKGTTRYAYQQVYTSPVFDDGLHTLQLKDAEKYVTIDAIEILAPPDLIPPAAISDLAAAPGGAYGSVTLTWTASGDDGGDGIARSYDVRYSPNPITDETTWNAATKVTSGVPSPKPAGMAETMTVGGFAPNLTYYFAIRVLDEPAPDSTPSGLSNSPSAITSGPPPSGAGGYDDKDTARWVYTGTWTNINTTSAYGNSYRWNNVLGNSASFVFNGGKFTLLYVSNSSGGTVAVLVDGTQVGTINMKSSITTYKKKFAFTVTAGVHTVQFLLTTSGRINVDGILIE